MPPNAPAAALPAAAAAPAPVGDGAARIADGAAAAASAPEKEGDSDDFEDISGEVRDRQGFPYPLVTSSCSLPGCLGPHGGSP